MKEVKIEWLLADFERHLALEEFLVLCLVIRSGLEPNLNIYVEERFGFAVCWEWFGTSSSICSKGSTEFWRFQVRELY